MNKKKIIRIAAVLLAAALTLALAACGNKNSTPETKNITFCLDWTPNTNHTGIYAAQAKGYFKDAGLTVKIVQPPENGSASLVGGGKAHFGIDAQDTMADALVGKNKLPITAVATILQHNTSGIISLKKNGITSPKKMAGHTYATWDIPAEKATLKQVVEDDGGDFSRIKLIPSTVTDEPTALKNKSVDTIWIFWGWAGIACKQAGLDTNFWKFADINKVFDYYTPVIIANTDFLKKNPNTAKAFMKAVSRGYEYAAKNPQKAADLLIDQNSELKDSKKLIYASQKYLSKEYIKDAKKWGYIDPARWNRFYNWMNQHKLTKEPLKSGTGFMNDYLPEK